MRDKNCKILKANDYILIHFSSQDVLAQVIEPQSNKFNQAWCRIHNGNQTIIALSACSLITENDALIWKLAQ